MNTRRNTLFLSLFTFFLLTSAAQAAATFPIATTSAGETSMGAAFDGSNCLVGIQTNVRGVPKNIVAQMISSTGSKVGTLIDTGRTGIGPSIAFDGTNYLMVWEDDQGHPDDPASYSIYGQFINTSGSPVGVPFRISSYGVEFDGTNILAYGGGKYLATYTKLIDPAMGENWDNRYIAGRLIEPNGTLGSEFRISSGYGARNSITFDGVNFFVVWGEDSEDQEIRGCFVSPAGVLGTEISINASAEASDNPLAVGFDGTNYLVVWNDQVTGGWDIFGQRISSSGDLVGGVITIEGRTGAQMPTNVVFDGENYLVVWVDMKKDANSNGVCDAGEGTCWDVYGRYIRGDGNPGGNRFVINADAGNQMGFVAGYDNGKYLVIVANGITLVNSTIRGGNVYGMFLTPPPPPVLTVTQLGTGSGNVTPDIGTLTWVDTKGSETYSLGDTVTLTAAPALHSRFTGWTGCTTINVSTCTVWMATARNVTAKFTADLKYALTVTKAGTGGGTITSDPAGVSCPGDCSEPYWKNEVVTLTATPADDSMFAGWSNGCTGTESTCSVTMTAAKTVKAKFIPYPTLNVTKLGKGSGAITSSDAGISCGNVDVPDCTELYTTPDTVTLTAEPEQHSRFTGWTGCPSASGSTCTVTMTAVRNVTGTFGKDPKYALTVTKAGTGGGTITSDPAGVSCPGDCSEPYWKNEVVTLTATPADDSTFSGWSDGCTGTESPCSVTMIAAKTVKAKFVLKSTMSTLIGSSWSLDATGTIATISWVDHEGSTIESEAFSGEIQIIVDPAELSASEVESMVSAHGGAVFARLPVLGLYWANVAPGSEASFIAALRDLVSDVFPNFVASRKVNQELMLPTNYAYSATNTTPLPVVSGNLVIDNLSSALCINCPLAEAETPIFILKDASTNQVVLDSNGQFVTTEDYTEAASHGDIVHYYSTNHYMVSNNSAVDVCTGDCANPASDMYGEFPLSHMPLGLAATIQGSATINEPATINMSLGPGEYEPGKKDNWEIYNLTNNWSSFSSLLAVLDSGVKGTDETMLVLAAGNGSTDITRMLVTEMTLHPASSKQVLMVGALDSSGNIADYSNYSTYSGGMIYVKVDDMTDADLPVAGTSFAAPQIQYLVNKIREGRPDLTPEQIRQIIFRADVAPLQEVQTRNGDSIEVPVISNPLSTSTLTTALNVANTLFPPRGVTFNLTVTKSGTGSGKVTANPSGLTYPAGTVVTLAATPTSGSTFAGWSGACSGTYACVVAMGSNQSVNARFSLSSTKEFTISMSKSGTGDGTVSASPPGPYYIEGTAVTLTASPDSDSTFTGWGGDCSNFETELTCELTMEENKAVTATFGQKPECIYTYTEWSECQPDNTQTREVTSSSPEGCIGDPVLTQSCIFEDNTCCACVFDVYCTAYGPGGCWYCHNSTYVDDVCEAPEGYLTKYGACVCDPDLYEVCQ